MVKYYLAFFVPLILAYFFTPIVKIIAGKVGAIDVPKDDRRVHSTPIPLLGGLAIYAAAMISMIIFLPLDKSTLSIMAGATIIVAMGIIDDVKPLPAKLKFAIQILAAFVLVLGDVKIEFITHPFDKGNGLLYLKGFSVPITLFWIVGITNTLNLIDGLDGLSAGVGAIASISLLFIASSFGYVHVMIMAATIAGSTFGFLPHNFNPAKIFMGDTGALFLGFMLSAIAIEGVMKSVATIAIVVPVLVLGLPIFDTTFAIFRRLKNKKPIMEADKGHIHHRLLAKGLSQKQTVMVLYMVSAVLGSIAVILSGIRPEHGVVIIGVILSLIILGAARLGVIDYKRKHSTKR